MRFIAEGYLNNRGKFPAGISLICFLLAGLVKIAEGGYVITKQVHSFSSNADTSYVCAYVFSEFSRLFKEAFIFKQRKIALTLTSSNPVN